MVSKQEFKYNTEDYQNQITSQDFYSDQSLYVSTNFGNRFGGLTPKSTINPHRKQHALMDFYHNKKIFILITGSYDLPKNIEHGKKSKDRASYLQGLYHDIKNFKDQFQNKRDVELHILETRVVTCSLVKEFILSIIHKCVGGHSSIVLYYTGHGAVDGSWCFSDGKLSPKDIRQLLNNIKFNQTIYKIISDSCYSGKFGQQCIQEKLSEFCYTSCQPDQLSYDSDKGGKFTRWLFGDDVQFNEQKQKPMGFMDPSYN